ncbi:DUF3060 domain-containing protein [Actinomyces timonensis]|uniref:DUF3060 domain-containing protein n=1 Tax=Actinomyces timonensis TaxID=1288391 RepID=A0AAU8N1K5_9ACTO
MTTLTRRGAATTCALALALTLGACAINAGKPDSANGNTTQAAQQEATQPAAAGSGSTNADKPAEGSASTATAPVSANPDIVEPDWRELLNNRNAAVMSPTNGQLTIASAGVHAIVREHVNTMTLSGSDIDVAATTVDRLVISGSSVDVYVENVTSVTITGTDVDVIYAGDRPTVEDMGADNTVRAQSAHGDD